MIAAGFINKIKGTIEIRHKCKSGVAVIQQQLEKEDPQEDAICETKNVRRLVH